MRVRVCVTVRIPHFLYWMSRSDIALLSECQIESSPRSPADVVSVRRGRPRAAGRAPPRQVHLDELPAGGLPGDDGDPSRRTPTASARSSTSSRFARPRSGGRRHAPASRCRGGRRARSGPRPARRLARPWPCPGDRHASDTMARSEDEGRGAARKPRSPRSRGAGGGRSACDRACGVRPRGVPSHPWVSARARPPSTVVAARVGREALWEEAVRSHLDGWFWNAAATSGVRPVASPEVDVGDGASRGGPGLPLHRHRRGRAQARAGRLDRARGRRSRGRGARRSSSTPSSSVCAQTVAELAPVDAPAGPAGRRGRDRHGGR